MGWQTFLVIRLFPKNTLQLKNDLFSKKKIRYNLREIHTYIIYFVEIALF